MLLLLSCSNMPLSRLLQVVVLGEFSGGVRMQPPAAALPCLTDAYIHFYDVPILCCSAAAQASRMHIFIFMMFPFYVGRNIIYQHMSYVCRLCSHFLVTYDLHNIASGFVASFYSLRKTNNPGLPNAWM